MMYPEDNYFSDKENKLEAIEKAKSFTKNLVNTLTMNMQSCQKKDIAFIYENMFYAYDQNASK